MSPKSYSRFQSMIHRFVSSRPGAWFSSRTLHHIDQITFKLTGGRMTMGGSLSGMPVVMVTTTGAKSGLPRTLPLAYIRDEQNPAVFALIASNWGQKHYPAWYFNLRANPQATCCIDGQAEEYVAHEASDEKYARFWQYAVETPTSVSHFTSSVQASDGSRSWS
jgi:deazaflavin-dependent oxidoreductase (nitroreductase family)